MPILIVGIRLQVNLLQVDYLSMSIYYFDYLHYLLKKCIPKIFWEWIEPLLFTVRLNQWQNCLLATLSSSWRFYTNISLVFSKRDIARLPVCNKTQIFCDRRLTDCGGHDSKYSLPYYLIFILKKKHVIFALVTILMRNLLQIFLAVDLLLLMKKLKHRNWLLYLLPNLCKISSLQSFPQ